MRRAVLVVLLAMAGGCAHHVKITSDIPGARILIDGKPTEEKTPASLKARAIPRGEHVISVEMEGQRTPPPRKIVNSASGGLIAWSLILWPAGIYNLFNGFSKNEPEELSFSFRDAGPQPAVATATAAVTAQAVERRRITQAGVRCAAMPMRTKDVGDAVALVIDELMLGELQQSGFQAIGPDDVNTMLGLDRTKQALGCDDASCAAELGAALGVDYLAAGTISSIEGSMVIAVKLIDVKHTRVLARASRVVPAGQGAALPQMIAEAVRDLVMQSGL